MLQVLLFILFCALIVHFSYMYKYVYYSGKRENTYTIITVKVKHNQRDVDSNKSAQKCANQYPAVKFGFLTTLQV